MHAGLERLTIQTDDGRHAARPMVALLFHQSAALADQSQRIAEVERAGGDQRGVFTQAVAGDEAWRLPLLTERLESLAHRGQARQRHGQDGRLRVDRVFELVGWTFEAQRRQLEAEDLVGLLEHPPRSVRRLEEGLAHAHVLGALARKHEG